MPESTFLYGGHTAFQRYAEGTQTNVGLDAFGGIKISQHLPSRYELAKAGRIYVASSATATAKAPVTAMPTTAAIFALWNGNPTGIGGLSLAILGMSAWHVSGTAGLGMSLIAGVTPVVQAAAVTGATNATVKSASGSTRTTACTLGTDITLTGAPSWYPFASVDTPAAAEVGGGCVVQLNGDLLVPPGFCLGMSVLSPVGTTALYGMAVIYAEVEAYLV